MIMIGLEDIVSLNMSLKVFPKSCTVSPSNTTPKLVILAPYIVSIFSGFFIQNGTLVISTVY